MYFSIWQWQYYILLCVNARRQTLNKLGMTEPTPLIHSVSTRHYMTYPHKPSHKQMVQVQKGLFCPVSSYISLHIFSLSCPPPPPHNLRPHVAFLCKARHLSWIFFFAKYKKNTLKLPRKQEDKDKRKKNSTSFSPHSTCPDRSTHNM